MPTPQDDRTEWDLVEEASRESFPASDPPAWGSSHAAPSESTVAPPWMMPSSRMQHLKRVAVALVAIALVGSVIEGIRRVRSC